MNDKKTTPSLPTKRDISRALILSPAKEEVVLYEKGRASDIAKKLKDMGSDFVTVLVMTR